MDQTTIVDGAAAQAHAAKTQRSGRRGLRVFLLAAVVAVGTGALALSQRVAAQLDRLVATAVEGGGKRVVIANAALAEDGSFDWQRPPAFTADDRRTLLDAGAGIRNASLVSEMNWRQIEVNGTAYKPGTVLGTDENYADVMGLKLLAGSFFPASDVTSRAKTVVLSQRAAVALFGDAASAVGQSIRTDRMRAVFRQGQNGATGRVESAYDSYTVAGVFKDVTQFERDAYDIPDYIAPYTAMFPAGMPIFANIRTFVARADSRDIEQVAAGLRASLAAVKGDGLKLAVWEGALARNGANAVERVRSTLKSLSLVAQLFGLAILAVASFGIVSGMMAEAAERHREFAIKRALGLTAFGAAVELCANGVKLAAIGAAVGFLAATLAGSIAVEALKPFLEALGVSGADITGTFFELRTLLAPLAAVGLAALFSLLPALGFFSVPIVDGLKE